MILLTSPTDVLHLTLSPAVTLDVNASFMDHLGTVVTPGRQNTPGTTQTDIDVVGSPAAGVQRSVKTLNIINTDPINTTQLSVKHSDGTTIVELRKVSLLPNERLFYIEGQWFKCFDATGAIK
jgi:hypothetical protein